MTKKGSTKIINFMTPRAGVLVLGCSHISHIVKVYYFLKNLLLYSHAYIRQTKYIVMMTNEGSPKLIDFMTPGTGLIVERRGHICHVVKMHYIFKNLLHYSQA